ncbi:MAG TPA: sulfatase-like hydrolase/transferase, partial [Planctomycetaceae bacterium]
MRKWLIVAGAAACLTACVAIWLWPRSQPNVLLITLDTTRADRLGCYGYRAARTPVLDSLAASGVLCERASTVAPLTLPAHTSLFTGLYPPESGVLTNGRGRLAEGIPTLAEELKRRGYDTGAFVGAFVLDRKFGLARGFRTYDDDLTG